MRGYKGLHQTSILFLDMTLCKSSQNCGWCNDGHNRTTYLDVGRPQVLSSCNIKKDCMSGYRIGTLNAFRQGKTAAAAEGYLFVGMLHKSLDGDNSPMHCYDISNYDVKDTEDLVEKKATLDF